MITVSKLYHLPAHAVCVFARMVEQQAAAGRSLHALAHGYSLGTGISLRFEFADSSQTTDYRLAYKLGRKRAASEVASEGWSVDSVLPMTAAWIPIGYFYLLKKKGREAAA